MSWEKFLSSASELLGILVNSTFIFSNFWHSRFAAVINPALYFSLLMHVQVITISDRFMEETKGHDQNWDSTSIDCIAHICILVLSIFSWNATGFALCLLNLDLEMKSWDANFQYIEFLMVLNIDLPLLSKMLADLVRSGFTQGSQLQRVDYGILPEQKSSLLLYHVAAQCLWRVS